MIAALIGVDWGTSNFRAFLLGSSGEIIDRRTGSHGILTVANGDFARMLTAQIGDWLNASDCAVLMSGMIGSRQGWVEMPYVDCPVALTDLALEIAPVPRSDRRIWIVPGVRDASGPMPDVMRGEETQVFGAAILAQTISGTFLLPGTHSKWVTLEYGKIFSLRTYMTGEIYAACRDHTILGRLMTKEEPDRASFAKGVRDGARAGSPGALLSRLFGVRTAGLFGEIAGASLTDYLSGVLIGAEFVDARRQDDQPAIIASAALAERYLAAAAELGASATVVDPDCITAGYLEIARLAGLLPAEGMALPRSGA